MFKPANIELESMLFEAMKSLDKELPDFQRAVFSPVSVKIKGSEDKKLQVYVERCDGEKAYTSSSLGSSAYILAKRIRDFLTVKGYKVVKE